MFNSLSSKERNAFITSQAKKLVHYLGTANEQKAAEALYNNRKFIDRFGLKAFNSLNDGTQNSYNIRKNLLRQDYQKQKRQNTTNKATLIQNTFKNVFGKDSNFEDLVSGLDDQGKIDLLKNKSYLSSNEISSILKQNAKETQEDANKRRGYFLLLTLIILAIPIPLNCIIKIEKRTETRIFKTWKIETNPFLKSCTVKHKRGEKPVCQV